MGGASGQLERVGRRARNRRGMTLLEAAMASILLGIASAMIFSAVGQMWVGQRRQQQLLGAAEVANRIILQYLDDRTHLPRQSETIAYGRFDYRWSLKVERVVLREPDGLSRDAIASRAERTEGSNRAGPRSVTVHVWLSDSGPRTTGRRVRRPEFTLTRLMDPQSPRNPDSFRKMIADPDLARELFGQGGGP